MNVQAISLSDSIRLPSDWKIFVDEMLPDYVKKAYSPRASWQDKPFGLEDLKFFSSGLADLSERYQKKDDLGRIFFEKKYRSAYLLYFLPLQMAKFFNLFDRYFGQVWGTKGNFVLADIGCGPATATLAFLLAFCQFQQRTKLSWKGKFEIYLMDSSSFILKDAMALVQEMGNHPLLVDRLLIKTQVGTFAKGEQVRRFIPSQVDLLVVGNVLNEGSLFRLAPDQMLYQMGLSSGVKSCLLLEPAEKQAARTLGALRQWMIEEGGFQVLAPCLHQQECPLLSGRDWCHFSVPTVSLGKIFDRLSLSLGSVRPFLKFSFLWVTRLPIEDNHSSVRILSDALSRGTLSAKTVLVCRPTTAVALRVSPEFVVENNAYRGGLLPWKK
jgi:ribosomal protein RSM22 (predicted rRNA methylase)